METPRAALLVAVVVAVAIGTTAEDANAKGLPTTVTIRGPGLERPIRLTGPDMPGPWRFPVLTGASNWRTYYSLDGPLVYDDTPPAALGRQHVIVFSAATTKERVLQDLYPCAAGGPWTFTPVGQGDGFWSVLGIMTEISGWWRGPDRLRTLLARRGIHCPDGFVPRRFF